MTQRKKNLVVIISEGAAAQGENETVSFYDQNSKEKEKLGGISQSLARWLENETKIEFRHQVVGYLQRGHLPTQWDRMLALEMGVLAAKLASAGQWSSAVSCIQGRIQPIDICQFMNGTRKVPSDHPWLSKIQSLGGFF